MKSIQKLIRKTINHGRVRWVADLPTSFTGKERIRRFFKHKSEAEKFVCTYHGDVRTLGEDMASQIHDLDTSERARLILSLHRLNEMGWTLEEAVNFIEDYGKNPPSISLQEMNRLFIAEKERKGCRPRHLANLRKTVGRFLINREEMAANDVQPQMVRDFINGNGWKPATRRSYLIDLRSFFSFGVKQKLTVESPAEAIEFPIIEDKPPEILSVETCRDILDSCQRTDPKLIPFVSLLFFAGL